LLRNDLIDQLTSCQWRWPLHEFLLLLINAQTKKLVLEGCHNFDRHYEIHGNGQEFASFVAQAVSRAPNLEHLSLDENFECNNIDLFSNDIKTSIISSIVELKELQYLSLYGYFGLDNEELMLLTKNLKNLVCLKVFIGWFSVNLKYFWTAKKICVPVLKFFNVYTNLSRFLNPQNNF